MKRAESAIGIEQTILVAGSSHPELAEEIARQLKMSLFPIKIQRYPDGEIQVHLQGDVAQKQAVVVQSMGKKPNEYLIETMLIADALRRGGVSKIVLACPYLAYSRQDLPVKSEIAFEGSSLAARLFAHFLHEAGISELVTCDLHAEHIPSFYDFPVEHVSARKSLVDALGKECRDLAPLVVVGPDLGSAKLVGHYAEELQSSFALIQKKRLDARNVEMLSLVGEVKGKNVLLADDMCSTAGTLESAAKVCQEKGAKRIFAAVTHGLFVDGAARRIQNSPIERLFVSNTIAQDEKPESKTVLPVESNSKISVISIAPTFAAAISRLVDRFSQYS